MRSATSLGALARYGGILLRPRSTVAALDPRVGTWDEWILTVLYVLGSQVGRIAQALASVAAVGLGNGILVLASGVGRAVLPPILVSVLVDSLLGRARGYRRGVFIVPLVTIASAARLAAQQGLRLPGPSYLPELVAAVVCAGLALYARSAVPVEEPDAKADAPAKDAEEASE